MTGGAFGLIASLAFPAFASSGGLYAILGMGAVAAAVIGAPISTAVMVFELTGGYTLSLALLLTVSIAVGINQAIHGRSYFQWQLEIRGNGMREGPHRFVARNIRVVDFMTPLAEGQDDLMPEEYADANLSPDTSLEFALRAFDERGHSSLPVTHPHDDTRILGWATQVSALRTYNNALVEVSVEEHR